MKTSEEILDENTKPGTELFHRIHVIRAMEEYANQWKKPTQTPSKYEILRKVTCNFQGELTQERVMEAMEIYANQLLAVQESDPATEQAGREIAQMSEEDFEKNIGQLKKFIKNKCRNCGGKYEWNPLSRALICPCCGSSKGLPDTECPKCHHKAYYSTRYHSLVCSNCTTFITPALRNEL